MKLSPDSSALRVPCLCACSICELHLLLNSLRLATHTQDNDPDAVFQVYKDINCGGVNCTAQQLRK
jgi:hypothetical protein